jgi:hypothetical protein
MPFAHMADPSSIEVRSVVANTWVLMVIRGLTEEA